MDARNRMDLCAKGSLRCNPMFRYSEKFQGMYIFAIVQSALVCVILFGV